MARSTRRNPCRASLQKAHGEARIHADLKPFPKPKLNIPR